MKIESTFLWIRGEVANSELSESIIERQLNENTIENVVNRVVFLSKTGCNTSPEVESIASHLHEIGHRSRQISGLSFSITFDLISHEPLKVGGVTLNHSDFILGE
jgi:hypothetical protein